jgi:phosphoglycolate phosphatase-like HAD superfamily hydrolase
VRSLDAVTAFAVLTNNSESAVRQFFRRFDGLASRLAGVVGRETLGGSKRNPERFRIGFERCFALTAAARAGGPVVYVGDARYELELAAELGASALDVGEIGVRAS